MLFCCLFFACCTVLRVFFARTENRRTVENVGLAVKVERNSFNLYRCFLAMYGPDTGPEELRKYIAEAEHRYSTAFRKLDESLAKKWLKQNELLKRHSLGSEGPQGGTWELPPPVDESAWRG